MTAQAQVHHARLLALCRQVEDVPDPVDDLVGLERGLDDGQVSLGGDPGVLQTRRTTAVAGGNPRHVRTVADLVGRCRCRAGGDVRLAVLLAGGLVQIADDSRLASCPEGPMRRVDARVDDPHEHAGASLGDSTLVRNKETGRGMSQVTVRLESMAGLDVLHRRQPGEVPQLRPGHTHGQRRGRDRLTSTLPVLDVLLDLTGVAGVHEDGDQVLFLKGLERLRTHLDRQRAYSEVHRGRRTFGALALARSPPASRHRPKDQ